MDLPRGDARASKAPMSPASSSQILSPVFNSCRYNLSTTARYVKSEQLMLGCSATDTDRLPCRAAAACRHL